MEKVRKDFSLKHILFLHLLFFLYSLGGICSKYASARPFLGGEFLFFYAGVILVLFLYALGWQQSLKNLPLSFAMANKSVCFLYAMLWGYLLFDEPVTAGKIFGVLLVMAGIVLLAREEEKEHR